MPVMLQQSTIRWQLAALQLIALQVVQLAASSATSSCRSPLTSLNFEADSFDGIAMDAIGQPLDVPDSKIGDPIDGDSGIAVSDVASVGFGSIGNTKILMVCSKRGSGGFNSEVWAERVEEQNVADCPGCPIGRLVRCRAGEEAIVAACDEPGDLQDLLYECGLCGGQEPFSVASAQELVCECGGMMQEPHARVADSEPSRGPGEGPELQSNGCWEDADSISSAVAISDADFDEEGDVLSGYVFS